jgi:hypothetical protein
MRRRLLLIALALVGLLASGLFLYGRDALVHGALRAATDDYALGRIEGSLFGTLVLEELSLEVAGTRFRAERLSAAVGWADLFRGRPTLRHLGLRSGRLEIPVAAPDPDAPPARIELPELPELPSLGLGDLDVQDLTIDAGTPIHVARLRASAATGPAGIDLDADGRLEGFELTLAGHLASGTGAHRLRASITATDGSVAGTAELDGNPDGFDLRATTQAPVAATVEGHAHLEDGRLEAELGVVRVEPADGILVRSEALALRIAADDLTAEGPLHLTVPGLPEQRIDARVHLAAWDRLDGTLTAATEGGPVPLRASAVLSEGTAQGSVRLAGWSPARALAPLGLTVPTELAFDADALRVDGTVAAELQDFAALRWTVRTEALRMEGLPHPLTVRARASGDASPTPRDLRATLALRAGDDRVEAALEGGRAKATVVLPDLARWLDGAAGHVEARAEATLGEGFRPERLGLDAQADAVLLPVAGGLTLDRLSLTGSLDGGGDGGLEGQLAGLAAPALPEPLDVDLRADGALRSPRAEVAVRSPSLDGSVRGTLVLDAAPVLALDALSVSTPHTETWQGTFEPSVRLPLQGFPVPDRPLCLAGPDGGSLCARSAAEPGREGLALELRALSVRRTLAAAREFLPTLPTRIDAEGTLRADVAYLPARDGDGDRASLRLAWDDAVLVPDANAEDPERIVLSRFAVEAEGSLTGAGPERLPAGRANLDVATEGGERAEAQAELTGQDVDAELHVEVPELARWDALLPGLTDPRGRILADLRFEGALPAPAVTGQLSLRGETTVDAAGVRWRDIRLDATGTPEGAILVEGSARAGTGTASLSGSLRPGADLLPTGELELDAAEVPFLELPDLTLHGDARIRTRIAPERIAVTGDTRLSRGRIRVRTLPAQSLGLSRDVTIVTEDADGNGDGNGGTTAPFRTVEAELRLTLGDDVRVEAAGIDARLAGDLRIEQRADRPLRLFGPLSVAEGAYELYGAELEVTQGRLDFDGPPESPAVALRARRSFPEQIVGVVVTGRPERLSTSLFAEPPLPDEDALTWLITGRGPGSGSSPGRDQLIDAALSLGLAGTGPWSGCAPAWAWTSSRWRAPWIRARCSRGASSRTGSTCAGASGSSIARAA